MVTARLLDRNLFAPFGEVLEAVGQPDKLINAGKCGRFHDLAKVDCADGRVGLSIFRGTPYALPLELTLMERHPLGSQAFVPLAARPFLVVVARDEDGSPGTPQAFLTRPGQGVNYHRNIWHGVLTPLEEPQDFLVVDYVGDAPNLEEFKFREPVMIQVPENAG